MYGWDFILRNFFVGIDHLLSQHIAHLFIRDPISLFSEKINQNDECDVDHFEVWSNFIFFFFWVSAKTNRKLFSIVLLHSLN